MKKLFKFTFSPQIKFYLKTKIIITLFFFIATLCSIPFGMQYFYGSLVGILMLFISTLITLRSWNNKISVRTNTMYFVFKISIMIGILIACILGINQNIFKYDGVDSMFLVINIFVIIIFLSIDWITAVIFFKYKER